MRWLCALFETDVGGSWMWNSGEGRELESAQHISHNRCLSCGTTACIPLITVSSSCLLLGGGNSVLPTAEDNWWADQNGFDSPSCSQFARQVWLLKWPQHRSAEHSVGRYEWIYQKGIAELQSPKKIHPREHWFVRLYLHFFKCNSFIETGTLTAYLSLEWSSGPASCFWDWQRSALALSNRCDKLRSKTFQWCFLCWSNNTLYVCTGNWSPDSWPSALSMMPCLKLAEALGRGVEPRQGWDSL